jgi:signal peptidase I
VPAVTPAVPVAARCASLRGRRTQRILQRSLITLWVGVVPALLAALALRFLVPPGGAGAAGAVAWLGQKLPLGCGVALFFLFSTLARYWRFRIPGGRYASALPAHLATAERDAARLADLAASAAVYELAVSPAMQRTLERTVTAGDRRATDAALSDLRIALESGDSSAAAVAGAAVKSSARPAFDASRRREVGATLGAVALAAAAGCAFRARIAEPYEVMSASMLPTLQPGDLVLGSKVGRLSGAEDGLPGRADVIAFQSAAVSMPLGLDVPDVLVKRVIGLPGDRVAMKDGQPIINGWAVPSCDAGEYVFLQSQGSGGSIHGRLRVEFLEDRAYLTVQVSSAPFVDAYQVKPGEVFVLGDNRGNSVDSRAWNGGRGGGVPLAAIDARVPRFLVGSHRGGDADFTRFGRSVDGLQVRVRLEGVNAQPLQDGIARCLASRPAETRPPRAGEPTGPSASRESP